MLPYRETGGGNPSDGKKGKERSFDATRPDGGQRSSEEMGGKEREPLDLIRHKESVSSEEIEKRRDKNEARYIDRLNM